jgi:hypothetical protein
MGKFHTIFDIRQPAQFSRRNLYVQKFLLTFRHHACIIVDERKGCKMEKTVVGFGFGMFCFFFMLTFLVQLAFAWGCILGLGVLALGWIFWEE